MKRLLCLASVVAASVLTGCGSSHVDPNVRTANAQDRAQALCQSSARSKNLRVSSSEEPYQVGNDRYLVQFKTRDAAGVVQRRCDVDLSKGHATIY